MFHVNAVSMTGRDLGILPNGRSIKLIAMNP